MSGDFSGLVTRARDLVTGGAGAVPGGTGQRAGPGGPGQLADPGGPGQRAVLGIAGPPGAGKTTLAEQLVVSLAAAPPDGCAADWVAHVPMDGFHLADVELERLGSRHRKGAPDTFDAYGYAALLRRLREDRDPMIYAPGFERVLEQPIAGLIGVPRTARLIVTEGNYLLLDDERWRPVRELLSEVWYADLGRDERLRRLIERHVRFGKAEADAMAWATGSDEHNAELIAVSRERADLLVPSEVLEGIGSRPAPRRS